MTKELKDKDWKIDHLGQIATDLQQQNNEYYQKILNLQEENNKLKLRVYSLEKYNQRLQLEAQKYFDLLFEQLDILKEEI